MFGRRFRSGSNGGCGSRSNGGSGFNGCFGIRFGNQSTAYTAIIFRHQRIGEEFSAFLPDFFNAQRQCAFLNRSGNGVHGQLHAQCAGAVILLNHIGSQRFFGVRNGVDADGCNQIALGFNAVMFDNVDNRFRCLGFIGDFALIGYDAVGFGNLIIGQNAAQIARGRVRGNFGQLGHSEEAGRCEFLHQGFRNNHHGVVAENQRIRFTFVLRNGHQLIPNKNGIIGRIGYFAANTNSIGNGIQNRKHCGELFLIGHHDFGFIGSHGFRNRNCGDCETYRQQQT